MAKCAECFGYTNCADASINHNENCFVSKKACEDCGLKLNWKEWRYCDVCDKNGTGEDNVYRYK
jgi:hypothetical protein